MSERVRERERAPLGAQSLPWALEPAASKAADVAAAGRSQARRASRRATCPTTTSISRCLSGPPTCIGCRSSPTSCSPRPDSSSFGCAARCASTTSPKPEPEPEPGTNPTPNPNPNPNPHPNPHLTSPQPSPQPQPVPQPSPGAPLRCLRGSAAAGACGGAARRGVFERNRLHPRWQIRHRGQVRAVHMHMHMRCSVRCSTHGG